MAPPSTRIDTATRLRQLRGWVGGHVLDTPFISPVGVLLTLARLNHFSRRDFFSVFGLRLRAHEDPTQVLAFSAKRLASFSTAVGRPLTSPGWRFLEWWPFDGQAFDQDAPWRLRVCATCAHTGFHCWPFQLPWIETCPWHGTRLLAHCRNCYRPLRLGDEPEQPPLRCACGVDLVSSHAALRASIAREPRREQWLGEYLDWSAWSRSSRHILLPQLHPWAPPVYAPIVNVPVVLLPSGSALPAGLHVYHRHVRLHQKVDYREELRMWERSFRNGADGVVELPLTMVAPLQAVARSVATRLPAGTLDQVEAAGLLHEGLLLYGPATGTGRADILFLPVQHIGDHAFVTLSGLPRVPLAMIGALLRATEPGHNDVGAAELIVRAVRTLLLRAYADGLRQILGRFIPAIYDHVHLRPRTRVPWVAFGRDAIGVNEIRISWVSWNVHHLEELAQH